MSDILQIRRGTAASATSNNIILAEGEFGYETDTGKLKIGDGITHWNSLAYYSTNPSSTNVEDEVPSGTKNGINTTFTLANIPAANTLKLFLNGIKLTKVNDFTISGLTLTMINIPYSTDTFTADYQY